MPSLLDAHDPSWPPKIRRLAALARAGLPVPTAVAVRLDAHLQFEHGALGAGPFIVRSALVAEDGPHHSAAGLGLSIADCHGADEVRSALGRLDASRNDAWLLAYRGPPHRDDAALVQQQVRGPWLVVAALDGTTGHIECHRPGDALAAGHTPTYAGPPEGWDDATAGSLRDLLDTLREQAPEATDVQAHGLDVELCCDERGRWWVVQLRPLSRPLTPGWDAFARQLQLEGQEIPDGELVLDAEHNPAPLSEAHASLMRWLAEVRPAAGDQRVLAGWLYVRTLVRDLPTSASAGPAVMSVQAAVAHLAEVLLPEARARLRRIEAACAAAEPIAVAQLLEQAREAFLVMIDAYLGVLVPARRSARRRDHLQPATRPDDPLTLRHREQFRDVLPASWDLASVSIGELLPTEASSVPAPTRAPEDLEPDEALTLLEEWDDHLFALGLAPIRRVYLRVATWRELGDDVFWLGMDELPSLDDPVSERIAARKQRDVLRRALQPPPRIVDRRPQPEHPRHDLQGWPIGASFEGRLSRREDLAHLLRDPPPIDAIVVLPALTAQAALALHRLGVRAVCCEHGGWMSHAALMARELGLSALVGCRGCSRIADGTPARLDTARGRLLVGPSAR